MPHLLIWGRIKNIEFGNRHHFYKGFQDRSLHYVTYQLEATSRPLTPLKTQTNMSIQVETILMNSIRGLE